MPDGELIETVGAVLSTVIKVFETAPADKFPAESDAVPSAKLIPSVPVPVMPEIVIVLEAFPLPETAMVPFAVPVLRRFTFDSARLIEFAPE